MSPHKREDIDGPSFQRIPRRPKRVQRAPAPPQMQSNYLSADHGPKPVPPWLITDDAALQFERGVLKTGKEADVFLVERTHGERVNLLAAKRYRGRELRNFENDALYRERQRTGDRRVDLAIAKGTRIGRAFRAQVWADHEFAVLGQLWRRGAPVPYPVQQRGTEIMLEYIGDETSPAPRLTDTRPSPAELDDLCGLAVKTLELFVDAGIVHADLSPYNVLVWDSRLVVIDFPQCVHPQDADGAGLLHRDVVTLLGWFARKGVKIDPEKEFGRLLTRAFQ